MRLTDWLDRFKNTVWYLPNVSHTSITLSNYALRSVDILHNQLTASTSGVPISTYFKRDSCVKRESNPNTVTYFYLFWPIPEYTDQYWLIPTYFDIIRPTSTYSVLWHPMPTYFPLRISTYSDLFRPIPTYTYSYRPTYIPTYFNFLRPICNLFRPI